MYSSKTPIPAVLQYLKLELSNVLLPQPLSSIRGFLYSPSLLTWESKEPQVGSLMSNQPFQLFFDHVNDPAFTSTAQPFLGIPEPSHEQIDFMSLNPSLPMTGS